MAIYNSLYKYNEEHTSRNIYKYDLSLLVICKNESIIIEEFVKHYKWQGVEHIYLIDNDSTDNMKELIQDDIYNGYITYYYMPEKHKQIEHYNTVFSNIKNETKWLIICDADEYMYLKNHTNIVEYINYINGWGKQIVFYWLLFGSNYLESPPPNNSLIYNYNRCSYDKSIYADHIVGKCMVDPKILDLKTINNTKILYPHSWYITKNAGIVDVNGNNLKLDKLGNLLNNSTKVNINDNAYIYHYELQSWKTYYLRKVSRNRDDINCKYTDLINDKTIFDTYYNEVVNNSIIELYDTLKILTKDSIT